MTKKLLKYPRSIADSNLHSRHTIKVLPDIETCDHPAFIEHCKMQTKVCYNNPLLWDFAVNLFQECVDRDAIDDRSSTHYLAKVGIGIVDKYVAQIKDRHNKHYTKMKIINNLVAPKPTLFRSGKDDVGLGFPVVATLLIKDTAVSETDSHLEVLFRKDIFSDLLEDKWKGKGGYIEVPQKLFPLIRNISSKELIGDDPHYRLQILSLLKNTYRKGSITVSTEIFKQKILSEFYKESPTKKLMCIRKNPCVQTDGEKQKDHYNFFKDKLDIIHDKLVSNSANEKLPILRNLYIDEDEVTLYYTT